MLELWSRTSQTLLQRNPNLKPRLEERTSCVDQMVNKVRNRVEHEALNPPRGNWLARRITIAAAAKSLKQAKTELLNAEERLRKLNDARNWNEVIEMLAGGCTAVPVDYNQASASYGQQPATSYGQYPATSYGQYPAVSYGHVFGLAPAAPATQEYPSQQEYYTEVYAPPGSILIFD
ncbi:hypothetical protein CBR_g635 [Chara braunii]|uniref:Uncharacterized protein n=1 Tax=Chara braunii TaxID=69332 RepID=A0A388KBU6_CHABU|nr:hypothetical protein CBR_g635 [Chara braunii]|eukprot:GBG67501.1 hypothetical protein CBR_g635 [Chara braunii]